MKFLKNIVTTFMLYSVNNVVKSTRIKNIHLPSCRNCIHYRVPYHNDLSSSLNKCSYFGTKNIQSDEIDYDFADHCRKDEEKCGLEGKYFKENQYVILSIMKHGLFSKLPLLITISYLCIVFIASNIEPLKN